jgi:hypothetical protein
MSDCEHGRADWVICPECYEESIEGLHDRITIMQAAIDEFCDRSEWAHEMWKKQPWIANLFELRTPKEKK